MDQLLHVDPHIIDTLVKKAKARGYSNIKEAINDLDRKDKLILCVVMRRYNLNELTKICELISADQTPNIIEWYQRSWTKTLVFAGDPKRLANLGILDFYGESFGYLGPIRQNDPRYKVLSRLLVPLKCEPTSIAKFKYYSKDAQSKIVFLERSLSVAKFVVQLIHIMVETAIEQGYFLGIPTIDVQQNIDYPDETISYVRIDRGATEVDAFSHMANVYINK